MNSCEIAIVGGGIAGASAAAMLGRRGIDCVVFEPHLGHADDFRCEKVDAEQLDRLRRCGLAGPFIAAGTTNRSIWVGRGGRVVERRPYLQITAPYRGMVHSMRDQIGGSARLIADQVSSISPSAERPQLTTASGETWSARLVVLATGPSKRLLKSVGLHRRTLSKRHSISIGFDLEADGGPGVPYQSLTWFPERFDAATSYLTVFSMGAAYRANLFVYRDWADPWLQRMKDMPEQTLRELMPGFFRVTGPLRVTSRVRVRAVDLVRVDKPLVPGVVLIGDSLCTSDPAAGNGFDKVWNDTHLLVDRCLPGWLQTPGMGVEKLQEFYEAEAKRSCDQWCYETAMRSRQVATSRAPYWVAHRRAAWAVQLGRGALRRVGERVRPSAWHTSA